MTLTEATTGLGCYVVYRPYDQTPIFGVIESIYHRWVQVRYELPDGELQATAKATAPERLAWATVARASEGGTLGRATSRS